MFFRALLLIVLLSSGSAYAEKKDRGYAPPPDRDPSECYYEPHGPDGQLVRACYEQERKPDRKSKRKKK
jgi:hypothetical protein